MINMILVLILISLMFYVTAKGPKYFDRMDKKAKARERTQNRYRWSNGWFAKNKTIADMKREVRANNEGERLIPVYNAGQIESYISL